MQTYRIHPNVSDVELMRRIHRAGGRCWRLVYGRRHKTLLTDRPIDAADLIMRPQDYAVSREQEHSW